MGFEKVPDYEKGKPPKPIFDVGFSEDLEETWGEDWGLKSAFRKIKKILVHRPREECDHEILREDLHFFNLPEGLPDSTKLREQHDNFVDTLRDEGAEVIYLDPEDIYGTYGLPLRSLTYVHETQIVKNGAVICRPAMGYKKGLEVYHAKRLIELGCPILHTIHGKGVFEASNLRWVDDECAIIGIGLRANREGVNQMKSILEKQGIEVHITHLPGYLSRREYQVGGTSGIFHLDMTFGMADYGLGLIYPAGVGYETINFLEEKGVELIELTDQELRNCAPNILVFEPRKVIIPAGNEDVRKKLEKKGIDVIEVEISEFVKGGGGPTCMTLPLIRERSSR